MCRIFTLIVGAAIFCSTCTSVQAQSCPSANDAYCKSLDTSSCRWTGCMSCVEGFCNCKCQHPCCGAGNLPGWCFSPAGNDCSWYEKCLAARFPTCTGTADDYAIAFGKKYCELFSARYTSGPSASALSPLGYQWLDATRKCLQQQLVSLLSHSKSTTCEEIKQVAFQSHPGCYLSPQPGAPGICDLTSQDWFNIFRVTKATLETDPAYYIAQAWSVAWSCNKALLLKETRKIRTLVQSVGKKTKRSASDYQKSSNKTLEQFYYALRLAESMSVPLQWNRSVMDWVAIPRSSSASHSEYDLVLVDSYQLGFISKPNVLLNLDAEVKSISDATASGKLSQLAVEGMGTFRVEQIEACGNDNCTEVYMKTAEFNSASRVSLQLVGVLPILAILYLNVW